MLPALVRKQLETIKKKYQRNGNIYIQSKEEMRSEKPPVPSPDDADALALTFAYPLAPHHEAGGEHPRKPPVEFEYDPYAPDRMVA